LLLEPGHVVTCGGLQEAIQRPAGAEWGSRRPDAGWSMVDQMDVELL
jgi:hypothetical protein